MAIAIAGWTVPLGAQEAPGLEFVFEENVTLGPAVEVGQTARGMRVIIPITGGTFAGPDIRGEVLPMGWDWQLRRADGCTEVKADYFLRTDDGVTINIVNTGTICPGEGGAPAAVRTHPVLEAPLGKYEWLSKGAFLGTLEADMGGAVPSVKIRIFRVR